jgi:hypothetical protein
MDEEAALGTTISLPESPTGWFDYGYAVLMDGTLGLVRTDHDVHAAYRQWRTQSERGRTPAKLWDGRIRLSVFDGSIESEAIEVPLGFAPLVDRLADGTWLIVASRAAEGETNACLYAFDGTPVRAIAMGDGIEYIRCAADGTIWAGYFDEGIFSGPNEDGSLPISSSGIAHFAPNGQVLWTFNSEDRADLSIADCYALTLSGNTLWSCFYTDFPIVRVRSGTVRHWRNGIRGASGLATDGNHVLLAGGYGIQSRRIALLCLEGEQARQIGNVPFQPPAHGAARLVQGHGATLHIVGQGRWTKLSVATMLAALNV